MITIGYATTTIVEHDIIISIELDDIVIVVLVTTIVVENSYYYYH